MTFFTRVVGMISRKMIFWLRPRIDSTVCRTCPISTPAFVQDLPGEAWHARRATRQEKGPGDFASD